MEKKRCVTCAGRGQVLTLAAPGGVVISDPHTDRLLVAARAATLAHRLPDARTLELEARLADAATRDGSLAAVSTPSAAGVRGRADDAWLPDTRVRLLGRAEYGTTVRRAVRRAKSRIWVRQFIVDARPAEDRYGEIADLLDGLVAAAERGVDVRVLLPVVASPSGPRYDINGPAAAYLAARGVAVSRYRGSHKRPRSHAKVLIADDGLVVGNSNWTPRGLHLNEDANVVVTGGATAACTWFSRRWSTADRVRTTATPTRHEPRWARYPSARVAARSVLASSRLVAGMGYVEAMVEALEECRSRALVSVFGLRCSESKPTRRLLDAVAAAHARHVDVRVLLDSDPAAASSGDLVALEQASVAVRRWPLRSRHHARCVVVDDAVFVGSVGWTPASLLLTDELAVLARGAALADQLVARFERWWAIATSSPTEWPIAQLGWPMNTVRRLREANVGTVGDLLRGDLIVGFSGSETSFLRRAARLVARFRVPGTIAWVRARYQGSTSTMDAAELDALLRPIRARHAVDLAPAGSFLVAQREKPWR